MTKYRVITVGLTNGGLRYQVQKKTDHWLFPWRDCFWAWGSSQAEALERFKEKHGEWPEPEKLLEWEEA